MRLRVLALLLAWATPVRSQVPADPSEVDEEKISAWVKALGAEDFGVRERAQAEVLGSFTPELAQALKARRVADPEARLRLRYILGKGPLIPLESQLSPETLKKYPSLASMAVSKDPSELVRALQIAGGLNETNVFFEGIRPESIEDRKRIARTAIANLKTIFPDWQKLWSPAKFTLTCFYFDRNIPLDETGKEALLAFAQGNEFDPRQRAIATLLRRNSLDEATEKLVVGLLKKADLDTRRHVVHELSSSRAWNRLPLVLDLLTEDTSNNRPTYFAYIREAHRDGAPVADALAEPLSGKDPAKTATAILVLFSLDLKKPFEEKLRELADHPDEAVRSNARTVLGIPK